jgi:phenylpyruvate tautomerase PptA (4-oxalocrotonate tautomerase family)
MPRVTQDDPVATLSSTRAFSVRLQVLTPVGVLDRNKQLGVVRELTDIVASAAGDPRLAERTWVLLTESPEGGWGVAGHANTGADLAEAARAEIAQSAQSRRCAEGQRARVLRRRRRFDLHWAR